MKERVEELTIADLINLAKEYCPFAQKVVLKKDISEDSNWSFVFEMHSKEVLNAVNFGEICVDLWNPNDEADEEEIKETEKFKVFDLSDSGVDYETLMTILSENEQEYVLCGESEDDIAEGKAHVEVYDKSCVISRASKEDKETNPEWAGDRFGEHYYKTGNEFYYCIAFCNSEEAEAYLENAR